MSSKKFSAAMSGHALGSKHASSMQSVIARVNKAWTDSTSEVEIENCLKTLSGRHLFDLAKDFAEYCAVDWGDILERHPSHESTRTAIIDRLVATWRNEASRNSVSMERDSGMSSHVDSIFVSHWLEAIETGYSSEEVSLFWRRNFRHIGDLVRLAERVGVSCNNTDDDAEEKMLAEFRKRRQAFEASKKQEQAAATNTNTCHRDDNQGVNQDAILKVLAEGQRKNSEALSALAAALASLPSQGPAAAAAAAPAPASVAAASAGIKKCAEEDDRTEILLTLRMWGDQVSVTHLQPRLMEDDDSEMRLRVSPWERSLTLSSLVFNKFRVSKATKDRQIREAAETLLEALFAAMEVNEGFTWLESLLIQAFRVVRRLAAERDGTNIAKVEQEFGTRSSNSKWDVFAAKHTNSASKDDQGARRSERGGRGRGKAKDTRDLVCRRCQGKGHFASSCKAPAPVSPNGQE